MRPPDEVRSELVREWLAKAAEDLGLSELLLSENAPYLSAIAFHAQQAAEKYLKGLLSWLRVEFPKTHDIDVLLDLVSSVDAALAEALTGTDALSPYAVETRYPGDFPTVSQAEAEEAVALARRVRDCVESHLPS